jgi:hypothetical protein
MTWAEREANKQSVIKTSGPVIWTELCKLIRQEVDDLKKNYLPNASVSYHEPWEQNIIVRPTPTSPQMNIAFRGDHVEVEGRNVYRLDVDDDGKIFITRSSDRTPTALAIDEVSREILKPVFALAKR